MSDATVDQEKQHRIPIQIERRYRVKKALSLLLCILGGAFFLWYVWPGITSPPALSLDYLIMILVIAMGFAALGFLVVVTWNERLARLENSRLTWPFPFLKKDGTRTRYVLLEEISEANLATDNLGRREAEFTLRDGTRLRLPQSVFGKNGAEVLDGLVRHIKGRSRPLPSDANRGG